MKENRNCKTSTISFHLFFKLHSVHFPRLSFSHSNNFRVGSFDSSVSSVGLETLIGENKSEFDLSQYYGDGGEASEDGTEDVEDENSDKVRDYKNNKEWWTLTEIENSSDDDSLEWDDEGFDNNIPQYSTPIQY